MAVTEIHPTRGADDYVDGNAELFERRKALQTQLAEMLADGADQRRTTRIRRSLDDVTAEIVQFNLGLVRSYCKRFTANSSREDSADFEAAGLLGLMRAIDSFDPSQGRFGAWAFKPIQREVLRAVRDADHPNVNLGDFERRPEILRAFRHLQGDDTRYVPSYAEVAAVVGATVDQVRRVITPPRFESVDQSAGEDNDSTLGDTIETAGPGPESVVVSSMMLSALRTYGLAALDPRELFVIVRRFGLDGEPPEKLAGIGETLGLSREAIRQIEAKAIAKIQHPMVLRKIHAHGRN
ncbi:MAG: sigma-70 family RNA polymerase sigma factor [Actinomycetota bacterium]|jgi:RNA polymerase primary sigma factor/RNA polymerase nonessential primary-like sigma factor